MEDEQKIYEMIESYLNGTLGDDQRVEFEQRLLKEPDLAKELELHQEVQEIVSDHQSVKLENTLKELGQKHQGQDAENPAPGKVIPFPKYLLIAASILLLAVVAWFILTSLNPPASTQELFVQHFEPYSPPSTYRGKAPKNKLQFAFELYASENYDSTLARLQKLNTTYPSEEQILFYMGVCQLAIGNSEKARQNFQSVIDLPDNQSKIQCQWYIALCWLKEGEREKAKPNLEELASYPNKYNGPALDILEDL